MPKKLFVFLALFATQLNFGLSKVIDYAKFPTVKDGYYNTFDQDLWEMGYYAFNYAPELTTFFAMLKQKYQIECVVETGTYYGGTTVLFSELFDEVHTVEINETVFKESLTRLKHCQNVTCHCGNSEKVLQKILPDLVGKRALFYLDAHWRNYWPLLDELREIAKTHRDNCIIAIDDFKVPGRSDIPYDQYDANICNYDYFLADLEAIFSKYEMHYLIPRHTSSRAKFIAIPKKWAFDPGG